MPIVRRVARGSVAMMRQSEGSERGRRRNDWGLMDMTNDSRAVQAERWRASQNSSMSEQPPSSY